MKWVQHPCFKLYAVKRASQLLSCAAGPAGKLCSVYYFMFSNNFLFTFQVLYHIFVGLTDVGSEDVLNVDILNAIGSFVLLTLFSVLLGIFFGVVAVLLTRISDHVPVVQPLFVVVFGYIAYIFAEMFHMSGILA